jgi:Ala-tRNA(Pro) deacylase
MPIGARQRRKKVFMYPRNLVKKLLDLKNIPYEHRVHPTALTAQQVAAAERIPGTVVAKTVVVKADNKFVMAVLPATAKVDLPALRETLRANKLRLAKEAEFYGLFPDSEPGAMPPFGNLYGLPVYADESLARDQAILFNAGTHQDAIRMSYRDFTRLAEPKICSLAATRGARPS